jgi:hypothetical protein
MASRLSDTERDAIVQARHGQETKTLNAVQGMD